MEREVVEGPRGRKGGNGPSERTRRRRGREGKRAGPDEKVVGSLLSEQKKWQRKNLIA